MFDRTSSLQSLAAHSHMAEFQCENCKRTAGSSCTERAERRDTNLSDEKVEKGKQQQQRRQQRRQQQQQQQQQQGNSLLRTCSEEQDES
jgi:hypothetical protein